MTLCANLAVAAKLDLAGLTDTKKSWSTEYVRGSNTVHSSDVKSVSGAAMSLGTFIDLMVETVLTTDTGVLSRPPSSNV